MLFTLNYQVPVGCYLVCMVTAVHRCPDRCDKLAYIVSVVDSDGDGGMVTVADSQVGWLPCLHGDCTT